MANRFMILLLGSIIDILLLRQIHVAAQQIKTVLAGEAVEFSCSLTETLPAGDVSWQIQWDSSNTPVLVNAETTASLYDSIFNTGHGDFRTVYRSEKVFRFTHYCTLIIENVQLDDAGIYNCKHVGNYRDRGIFSEHELRVLPRPPDSALPRCSHSVITPSTSPQNNIIQLSCQFSGGNPPAQLVWYKEGMRIGEIRENTNIMEYQLRPFDNGVEFSCHAMSPALSETSYCHVMPLEIYPSVMLLPASVMATSGAYVRFTCSGQGLPSIDRIDWYVDGVLQSGSSRGVVQTDLKTSNASYLTLHDLQEDENGMDVMCEVVLPSGLTANSLTRIAMITGPTATVRVSHPPTDRPTLVQTTAQVTKARKAATLITNTLAKTTFAQSGPKAKTTHTYKRVAILDGKSDNSRQDPSQKKQSSTAPVTATVVVFICLLIIIVIIVVVVKKRRNNPRKKLSVVPDSPTDSLPAANNPLANEFENSMYEGTIYNTSQRNAASENFYQAAPLEEDPGKTWSTFEGCGIWEDSTVHHYENTAIGCPIPTFARQNNNLKNADDSEEKQKMLQDIVEKEGETL